MRDVLNWMDFSSVAKTTFHRFMPTGQNVCLIPGGFEEATLYERGKHRVYIKKRFGFIKLALQYGYKVHPVYTFGEEYAYHTFPHLLKLRLKLNQVKLPGVIFYGLPQCFFLPCSDVDLITVVGEALVLPRIEHPTKDDVQKYHTQYVQALQKLFDKYKSVFAVDPDAKLEVY
ncbi:Diacylglycerol acyltransferase [Phytophthora cinnamomi]|uniref:Diacylglycerol acyltransferase n=1 Tax=Phytophthora cinnamomi TaxID=4785 RepID=UPI00355A9CCD|nr:Diacylglycerol acyltransferase [Phytophthora cinnamomi]